MFPEAGTLVGAVLLLTGVLVFAAQRSTEPPVAARGRHPAHGSSPLRAPGMRPLLAVFLATGAVFGSMEVVTIAFADERGHRGGGRRGPRPPGGRIVRGRSAVRGAAAGADPPSGATPGAWPRWRY